MRFILFTLVLALMCGVQVASGQTTQFPTADQFAPGRIRLIAAEEVVDPVQPQSVFPQAPVYTPAAPAPQHAFDGSVSTISASGEGSVYSNLCDCCDIGGWQDNTLVWAGFDSFRSRGDGLILAGPISPPIGNSTGGVVGFNTAFGLGDSPIRAQVGGSYGIYDWKGRWLPFSDASPEQQTFITLGVSKRSDVCHGDPISWGVVFDQMFDHQWGLLADEIYLTQFRFLGGYAINECNEVGFVATVHTQSDVAQGIDLGGLLVIPGVPVRAMNQANLFLRQNWEFGGTTKAFVGWLDAADVGDWLFGIEGTAPLNNYTSLYGGFTYVAPGSGSGIFGSSLEQWNLSIGVVYSFGGKAVSRDISGPQGLPLVPVANNSSFLVTD